MVGPATIGSASASAEPPIRPAPSARMFVLGGPFGERPQSAIDEVVACFAEHGGQWLETAHAYAGGAAETSVAAALAAVQVDLSVITKVGHPTHDGRSTLLPAELRAQAEASRDRLGRPADLILLHRDDEAQPVDALAESLADMLERGAARAVGVSNWRVDRAIEARALLGRRFVAASLQLSVVRPVAPIWPGTRFASDADLDVLAAAGLDLIAWSPLARGWVPAPDHASPEVAAAFESDRNRKVLDDCDRVAVDVGLSRSEVALAAVLGARPNVRPVVGAARPAEVQSMVRVARFVEEGGGDLVATRLRATT